MDLKTTPIGTFPISLKCLTISLTSPDFFKLKEMKKSLLEIEKKHSQAQEKHSKRVITIDHSRKTYCGNDKAYKTSLCESTF